MRRAFTTIAAAAAFSALLFTASAEARMGGGFGGHMGGFGGHMGGFGGHMGGMGSLGPRTGLLGAGLAMRGPPAGGFGRMAFVGARPFGPHFVGRPVVRHAFFGHRRFIRNRFAFAAFPFVSYAASYDTGCWARVWTPYGLVWQNYCGYDYW